MILTDYYKGENLPGAAKTRYDIVASTGEYEPFEQRLRNRAGGLSFYFTDVPTWFKFSGKDRPDKCISAKGDNISSVFVPDPSLPFGYGDVKGTSDALLIGFSEFYEIIELFIARGQRNNRRNLYTLFCDGELEDEIQALRKRANGS